LKAYHACRGRHCDIGTLLSQLGVPVAIARAQLGHADPRITLQFYTHVQPEAQRAAVNRLERYLFSNVPKFAEVTLGPGWRVLTQLEPKFLLLSEKHHDPWTE